MSEYQIVWRDNQHWCPEMPRIVDGADRELAICADIDAAEIILLAIGYMVDKRDEDDDDDEEEGIPFDDESWIHDPDMEDQ